MPISDVIGKTVSQFVDYAMIIVTIMVLWYIFKFFFIAPPPTKEEREEDLEQRRKAWGSTLQNMKQKRQEREEEEKKKQKRQKKRKEVQAVKGFLVNAVNLTEDIANLLAEKNRKKAKKQANKLKENLHNAWRELQEMRQKESDGDFGYAAAVQTQRNKVVEDIINKMPAKVTDNWERDIQNVVTKLKEIKNHCLPMLERLGRI